MTDPFPTSSDSKYRVRTTCISDNPWYLHPQNSGSDVLLVAEVAAGERSDGVLLRDRQELLVELVHQRHRRGDVQLGDHVLGDVVEVLDEGAEGVPVGRDEHVLAGQDLRSDVVLPVRQHALERGLETLRLGALRHEELVLVLGVVGGVVLAVDGAGWRRHVVGAAPDVHLLLPVLVHRLLLVEPLERAVVALVQLPGADDRDEHVVRLLLPNKLTVDIGVAGGGLTSECQRVRMALFSMDV